MTRSSAFWFTLLFASAGGWTSGCSDDAPPPVAGPQHFETRGDLALPGHAVTDLGDGVLVATDRGLEFTRDGGATLEARAADGLPLGHITSLTGFGDSNVTAYVWGKGLFRSTDGGATFSEQAPLPPYSILAGVVTPRARVVVQGSNVDPGNPERGVIAGMGGMYLTDDAGENWALTEVMIGDGKLYVLFVDADVSGDTIVAAATSPKTLLPPNFADLVGGGVVLSTDGGKSWSNISADLPLDALTSVAIADDGSIYAAGFGGAFRYEEGAWTNLGGPKDVLELRPTHAGVSVGTGTRGVWRREASAWSSVGSGAVTDLSRRVALGHDGSVMQLEAGNGSAPPLPANGKVHLNLSFHVNLYHSFRGDAPDETGYGLDIDVIRTTLDWLDKYPDVHADWDMENFFSVDGWLASDAPDILSRVKARVDAGQDQIRLMSWNNGAMSASSFEEFEAAVERAKTSNIAAFGSIVPGVQPQENMFSPDHVAWYPQLGINWITLFNSMSPFTAFPLDHSLEGANNFRIASLTNGDDEMDMVPVYSHADVLDHGSLRAWVQQISDTYPGDTLLSIHFDADSESWINFDGELAALRDLEFLEYTNLQPYITEHAPTASVLLEGDQADGIGDGYQSWAEKDINHELYTLIVNARERAEWARALAPTDAIVTQLVDDALTPRLLALSTTNFGLASPYLAPDREISARAYGAEAVTMAQDALDAAEDRTPVPAGTIDLVNTRPSAGPALVSMVLEVPASAYTDLTPLRILLDGTELPAEVAVVDDAVDPVRLSANVVVDVSANSTTTLTWDYDVATPSNVTGGLADSNLVPARIALNEPFTECLNSGRADASLTDAGSKIIGARNTSVALTETFELPFCDGTGSVSRTQKVHARLPGIIVSVDALMGDVTEPTNAESVALTPFSCPEDVRRIRWQTHGGVSRSRPSRKLQESWNGQAADGWVAYLCENGPTIQISHRVLERSSIAFSPMRNDTGQAIFAPLGTLWGDTPWHFGRRIGGTGIGDIVGIITPQFNPAAPDWSGKTVSYRLLVGEDIAEATLDLFAHPPLVRPGAYLAP